MAAVSEAAPVRLLVLPGDGIGPEVVAEALKVVAVFERRVGRAFAIEHGLVGGASIEATGMPLTEAVIAKAKASNAILFGAVGGPQWDCLPVARRPEAGLIQLRRELDLYANLRPAVCFPELISASSLKPELLLDVDIMIVRELTSGVYFGRPRGRQLRPDGTAYAYDTQAYTHQEIERVVRAGFQLARSRRRKLCSVDKANVMETGAFWRSIATRVAADYPEVELSHLYADNAAMQLMRAPAQFDVMVMDNLFGDILSDEAAMLTGSLGLLPSASLHGVGERTRGLYEPVHGSAPDIAGQGIANPLATILSFALCLRYSLGFDAEALLLEDAVRAVLAKGARTKDIAAPGGSFVTTSAMTQMVISELEHRAVQ